MLGAGVIFAGCRFRLLLGSLVIAEWLGYCLEVWLFLGSLVIAEWLGYCCVFWLILGSLVIAG